MVRTEPAEPEAARESAWFELDWWSRKGLRGGNTGMIPFGSRTYARPDKDYLATGRQELPSF
jgi:hypothetical protein